MEPNCAASRTDEIRSSRRSISATLSRGLAEKNAPGTRSSASAGRTATAAKPRTAPSPKASVAVRTAARAPEGRRDLAREEAREPAADRLRPARAVDEPVGPADQSVERHQDLGIGGQRERAVQVRGGDPVEPDDLAHALRPELPLGRPVRDVEQLVEPPPAVAAFPEQAFETGHRSCLRLTSR